MANPDENDPRGGSFSTGASRQTADAAKASASKAKASSSSSASKSKSTPSSSSSASKSKSTPSSSSSASKTKSMPSGEGSANKTQPSSSRTKSMPSGEGSAKKTQQVSSSPNKPKPISSGEGRTTTVSGGVSPGGRTGKPGDMSQTEAMAAQAALAQMPVNQGLASMLGMPTGGTQPPGQLARDALLGKQLFGQSLPSYGGVFPPNMSLDTPPGAIVTPGFDLPFDPQFAGSGYGPDPTDAQIAEAYQYGGPSTGVYGVPAPAPLPSMADAQRMMEINNPIQPTLTGDMSRAVFANLYPNIHRTVMAARAADAQSPGPVQGPSFPGPVQGPAYPGPVQGPVQGTPAPLPSMADAQRMMEINNPIQPTFTGDMAQAVFDNAFPNIRRNSMAARAAAAQADQFDLAMMRAAENAGLSDALVRAEPEPGALAPTTSLTPVPAPQNPGMTTRPQTRPMMMPFEGEPRESYADRLAAAQTMGASLGYDEDYLSGGPPTRPMPRPDAPYVPEQALGNPSGYPSGYVAPPTAPAADVFGPPDLSTPYRETAGAVPGAAFGDQSDFYRLPTNGADQLALPNAPNPPGPVVDLTVPPAPLPSMADAQRMMEINNPIQPWGTLDMAQSVIDNVYTNLRQNSMAARAADAAAPSGFSPQNGASPWEARPGYFGSRIGPDNYQYNVRPVPAAEPPPEQLPALAPTASLVPQPRDQTSQAYLDFEDARNSNVFGDVSAPTSYPFAARPQPNPAYAAPTPAPVPAAQPAVQTGTLPSFDLNEAPRPQQTTTTQPAAMPAQQIAADTGKTQQDVPAAVALPGVGPMVGGIQGTLRAIGDAITGGRQIFGEDGIIPPSDPYTIDDFMADQRESDRGSDREQQAADDAEGDADNGYQRVLDKLGKGGGGYTVPVQQQVNAPYIPPTAVAQTPQTPTPTYRSYNDLMAAAEAGYPMTMAGGGMVRPSMTNAFTPNSYYAMYDPRKRGLGGM